jgi:hypothetical protein
VIHGCHCGHEIVEHLGDGIGVRARAPPRLFDATNLRSRYLLHGFGDLLRILQRPDAVA